MGVKMDADALRAFLEETFPAAVALGFDMEEVSEEGVRLTLTTGHRADARSSGL